MVKSTGAGTLKYRYADLVNVVATENRAPERRFHSLAVDVESAKSADRLWLVQAEGTTDRYDNGWDGEKIFAPGETALYAMQDRSYQVTTTETIGETKLGFVPAEGEQNIQAHLPHRRSRRRSGVHPPRQAHRTHPRHPRRRHL